MTHEETEINAAHYAKGHFLSAGLSGIVELLEDGTVLKSPYPGPERDDSREDIEFEAMVYRLLGVQERLVKMLRHNDEGLVLQHMANGDLKEYLADHTMISMKQKLTWACEAAEGLQLLHSHNIIHCDTKPRNFLLDDNLSLKIIDFSGSAFTGSRSRSCQPTRYHLPRHWKTIPSIATDLFALGSTIYEIMTGSSPYEDLSSDQVVQLYKNEDFPDVSTLPCAETIKKCWKCEIDSAQQVSSALMAILDMHTHSSSVDCIPHHGDLGIARSLST